MTENAHVIEAEIIEPEVEGKTSGLASDVISIPMKAAEALDAFADTLHQFVPAKAEDLHKKADAVRNIAQSTERAVVAGSGLMDSVKRVAQKLEDHGLGVGFIAPRTGRRRG